MAVEIVISGASLFIAGVASWGVIMTWRRNGRAAATRDEEHAKAAAARDQEIKDNQRGIINRLDDKETGLTALNEKLHSYEVICAGARSGFDQRILAAERDVKELKHKPAP